MTVFKRLNDNNTKNLDVLLENSVHFRTTDVLSIPCQVPFS